MKEYIIISGLNLSDNNRGTAALSYGSFSFLKEKNLLPSPCKIVSFRTVLNPFKKGNQSKVVRKVNIQGIEVEDILVNVTKLEWLIYKRLNCILPFSTFGKTVKSIKFVAAINGGDGFSDIYDTRSFLNRLSDIELAMKNDIPVVFLPQTIGPFQEEKNAVIASEILKYAEKVYVRDDKYIKELNKLGVNYEKTKDLSYYMKPEPVNVSIEPHAIGINVSGLTYSNQYRTLSGQFENYPYFIKKLIEAFQQVGVHVYLIPHSYNYNNPENNNDDMVACKQAYDSLQNKENVHFISDNLKSPQVKYVISQMSYFVGTRMHANFAAIYTRVPLYGVAYSYKFEGAFKANGVYDNNVTMINNASTSECEALVDKIIRHYHKSLNHATV